MNLKPTDSLQTYPDMLTTFRVRVQRDRAGQREGDLDRPGATLQASGAAPEPIAAVLISTGKLWEPRTLSLGTWSATVGPDTEVLLLLTDLGVLIDAPAIELRLNRLTPQLDGLELDKSTLHPVALSASRLTTWRSFAGSLPSGCFRDDKRALRFGRDADGRLVMDWLHHTSGPVFAEEMKLLRRDPSLPAISRLLTRDPSVAVTGWFEADRTVFEPALD